MNKSVSIAVRNNNTFLLFFHKKLNAWAPPGGKIDDNELPEIAAVRELKEEVDIDCTTNDILLFNKTLCNIKPFGNFIIYNYLLDVEDHVNPINKEPEKHTNMSWCSIDTMKNLYNRTYSAEAIIIAHKAFDEYKKLYKNK